MVPVSELDYLLTACCSSRHTIYNEPTSLMSIPLLASFSSPLWAGLLDMTATSSSIT